MAGPVCVLILASEFGSLLLIKVGLAHQTNVELLFELALRFILEAGVSLECVALLQTNHFKVAENTGKALHQKSMVSFSKGFVFNNN